MIKKTHYQKGLEILESIQNFDGRRKFIENFDFSVGVENEQDAKIIKDLRTHLELIKGGILKDTENKYKINQKVLDVLKDETLFNKITEKEFSKKIVGEEKSRKAIFLSLCSIWLKDVTVPLNTLVSSESSAGKSFVSKKIRRRVPSDNAVLRYYPDNDCF